MPAGADHRPNLIFSGLAAVSAVAYAACTFLVRSDNTSADLLRFLGIFFALSVLWAISLWLSFRREPSLKLVIGGAVLFRLLLIPAGISLETGSYQRLILYDDDVWRYLWEGHVWSAGVNPARVAPAALEEYELEQQNADLYRRIYDHPRWSEVFDNVGYREVASPYPHVAQGIFVLAHRLAPGSVLGFKLLMVLFDLAAVGLLLRLTRQMGLGSFAVLAYAWNPLVVKEFAGSGHLDAVLVVLLLAAASLPRVWGSVALGLGVLVKPLALLLAPALFKRLGWKGLAAPIFSAGVMLAAFPDGLKTYVAEWTFNPLLFRLLPGSRSIALATGAVILAALVAYRFYRDSGSLSDLADQAVWLFGALLLLTPMFAPWYLTWVLPFAALRRAWFWLAMSGSVFLSYHAYLRFAETGMLVFLEVAIPALIWVGLRQRPASHAEGGEEKQVWVVSSIAGLAGGLCCLPPIVMVLLGVASTTAAASFGDVLYGRYRWVFRLVALLVLGVGLFLYFRRRGVCSLEEAKRRRNWMMNVSLLVFTSTLAVYIVWTYVVLHYWGTAAGLPWGQYDESWAIPAGGMVLVAGAVLLLSGRRWGSRTASKL